MRKIVMLIVTLALAATLYAADVVPYGHKDFVPTPEQPIGYRGDGTGVLPGATPVTEFWEGTPVRKNSPNPPHSSVEYWAAEEDGKSKNIIWKTAMPGWAHTQPIVVGNKVFTKAELNQLICVDADTGMILWTRTINPWEIAGAEPKLAERLQTMAEIYNFVELDWVLLEGVGMSNVPPLADAYTGKVQARVLDALKELDPGFSYEAAAQAQASYLEKLSAAAKENNKEKFDALMKPKEGRQSDSLHAMHDLIGKRINDLGATPQDLKDGKGRRVGMKIILPWSNLVGFCPSTPVSDGKLVYAHFGQDQVVAYDLDGNRVWARFLPRKPSHANMDHFPSPVLADGILLVNQDCENLVGLDASTGKTVWTTPGASSPGGYSVGTPKVMTLTTGAEKLRVLVTESCKIVRISDGKIVGTLPWEGKTNGGPSITGVGDIVVKGACGDGFAKPLTAFRLTLKDKDTVEAVKVREIGGSQYQGLVISEDLQVFTRGNMVGTVIQAGKYQIYGSNSYGGSWGQFGNYDLSLVGIDGKGKVISSSNVLAAHIPSIPTMEKYAPEVHKLLPTIGGWVRSPSPTFFKHCDTDMTAQGDRLYIRSTSHLYCLGSTVKGTPQDDPKVAVNIRSLTKVDVLLQYLEKTSALERHEATLVLSKLGPVAAPATAKLTTLVKEDVYEEIRAAAVIALDAIDPTGKPGTVALQSAIAGLQGTQQTLARTLTILGSDRAASVAVPFLAKGRPEQERRNAARILSNAGVFNAQITTTLVEALQGDGDVGVIKIIGESIPLWPGDPTKAILLRDTLAKPRAGWYWPGDVPDGHGRYPGVLAYIANNLPEAERVPYLKDRCNERSKERNKAIEILRQLASGSNKSLAEEAAKELKAIEATKP